MSALRQRLDRGGTRPPNPGGRETDSRSYAATQCSAVRERDLPANMRRDSCQTWKC
jgi:hypothetical protein